MTVNEDKLLTQIAKEHLDIETLEVRKIDALDFHDVGVASLRKALYAAYWAGYDAGHKA